MIKATRPAGRRGPTVISNEAVYQCFVDLSYANPPIQITKKVVAQEMHVPFEIISDHTDRLFTEGRIKRVNPGVYVPTNVRPDRAVSATVLPGGGVKLEIGDDCLDLTVRESKMILLVLGGFGMQFDRIQKGRDWARKAADMTQRLKAMQQQLRHTTEEVAQLKRGYQMPLITDQTET
jgi:hypothetical protein